MTNHNSKNNDIIYTLVQIKETEAGIKKLSEKLSDPLPCFGKRHIQVILGFFAIFISYSIRASLSVAIVAMTNPDTTKNKDVPTYSNWPVSLVLSSFFWGYILPQGISGWATSQFGSKWLIVSSVSVGSTLNFLIPWTAARFGYLGVCLARATQGLFLGCIMPCVFYMLSQWVPPSERARLGSMTQTGASVGTVFSLASSGFLSGSRWGWPMVFYLYGILGLIWCAAMAIFGYDRPADHPSIDVTEKFHIERSLGHAGGKKKHNTPWKSILTSAPVWSLLMMQTGSLLLFYTLLAQIPTYLSHVMKFGISSNSMLSSIPYVLYWIFSILTGCVCDFIINKKYVTVTTARKIFSSIGVIVPSTALVCLGYTESHEVTQGVVLMMVAVALNSTISSGWGVNHIDLAPNHTGTLVGLLGTIANSTGFIGPLLVQYIVNDLSDSTQWRIVFLVIAGCSVVVTIVYAIFGSGEVQLWNDDSKNNTTKESEN